MDFCCLLLLLVLLAGGQGMVFGQDEDADPPANVLVFVEQDPIALNIDSLKSTITYPPRALEVGLQGRVIVKLLVDQQGTVKKHIIVKSTDSLFTKEIESKVYALRFKPAIHKGKTVKHWTPIPFDFRIKAPQQPNK